MTDDIVQGGKLKYENGAIAVPTGPGLGVQLDRDKVAEYRELYLRLGSYPDKLSFLDLSMKSIVEPGWFDIMVGTSSVKYETVTLEVTAK